MLKWLSLPILAVTFVSVGLAADPIRIGSRLELMVDDYLIQSMSGLRLTLNRPTPREVVIVHDKPWEGSGSGYHTVFRDGDLYRMYYTAAQSELVGPLYPHPLFGAYAESKDGIHWEKPELGLFEFNGSKKNNIVWDGPGAHDFTPFRDTNPDCKPEARYKAVARWTGIKGVLVFKSPDGIHWSSMNDMKPVLIDKFDSQNLAFWDTVRGQYRGYFRGWPDGRSGCRDILTATSEDFVHWTKPVLLEYPGAPKEQLYTNQIIPYYRAPHIFIGFPTRYIDRGWSDSMRALPNLEHRQLRAKTLQRYGTALTDGLLMTSRDGRTFHRWPEVFLRPGPGYNNWVYGDNYQNWGIVETKSDIPGAPNELSIYATEDYGTATSCQLRRFTVRIDGFVSIRATLTGGEMVTKPLVFSGSKLLLNFATSAAGEIRVEIQTADGKPIEGFSLADCPEIFGDMIERAVAWKGGPDVSKLAGKPVRLRFVMKDADLYSLRFQ